MYTTSFYDELNEFQSWTCTLLLPGSLINDNLLLGPRRYLELIWTFYLTCGTIIEQFQVKGDNQWAYRYPKNWPSYSYFPQQEKYLKVLFLNSTYLPWGGLKGPLKHFCDCSGTGIARILKIFDFSQNQVEQMLK